MPTCHVVLACSLLPMLATAYYESMIYDVGYQKNTYSILMTFTACLFLLWNKTNTTSRHILTCESRRNFQIPIHLDKLYKTNPTLLRLNTHKLPGFRSQFSRRKFRKAVVNNEQLAVVKPCKILTLHWFGSISRATEFCNGRENAISAPPPNTQKTYRPTLLVLLILHLCQFWCAHPVFRNRPIVNVVDIVNDYRYFGFQRFGEVKTFLKQMTIILSFRDTQNENEYNTIQWIELVKILRNREWQC